MSERGRRRELKAKVEKDLESFDKRLVGTRVPLNGDGGGRLMVVLVVGVRLILFEAKLSRAKFTFKLLHW